MIETSGLRKSFRTRKGAVEAVRGVDLKVREGEIFGFLGPNGAGKTTTLRMLATLIVPDDGQATVAGADLRRNPGEVRRMEQHPELPGLPQDRNDDCIKKDQVHRAFGEQAQSEDYPRHRPGQPHRSFAQPPAQPEDHCQNGK